MRLSQFELDIRNPKFYTETLGLMQRIDISTQQKLLSLLHNIKTQQDNKDGNHKKEFLKGIDSISINEFVQTNVKKEIRTNKKEHGKEIIDSFVDNFILRQDIFTKYYSKIYKNKKDLEKDIDKIFNMEDLKDISKDNIELFINDKMQDFRNNIEKKIIDEDISISSADKMRVLYLRRDNSELLSRTEKVYKVLENKNVPENIFDTEFKTLMVGITDKIFKTNSKHLLLTGDYHTDNKMIIEEAQKTAQMLSDKQHGFPISETARGKSLEEYLKKEKINEIELPSSQSKGANRYSDYAHRLKMIQWREPDLVNTRSPRSYGEGTKISNSKLRDVNKNLSNELKNDFKELIKKLLELSNVPIEEKSRPYFVNQYDLKNLPASFLDQSVLKNLINVNIIPDTNKYELPIKYQHEFNNKFGEINSRLVEAQKGDKEDIANKIVLEQCESQIKDLLDKREEDIQKGQSLRYTSGAKFILLLLSVVDSKYLNEKILNTTDSNKNFQELFTKSFLDKHKELTPEIIEKNIVNMFNYSIHVHRLENKIKELNEISDPIKQNKIQNELKSMKENSKVENVEVIVSSVIDIAQLVLHSNLMLNSKKINLEDVLQNSEISSLTTEELDNMIEKVEANNFSSLEPLSEFSEKEVETMVHIQLEELHGDTLNSLFNTIKTDNSYHKKCR